MPSHGDTHMPPGVAEHVKALCEALDLLVRSRKLTQKQAAAKSGLTVYKVRTLLGKNKVGGIDYASLCRLVRACETTPGKFFAAAYGFGFKPAEDLSPLPDLHDESPGPTPPRVPRPGAPFSADSEGGSSQGSAEP